MANTTIQNIKDFAPELDAYITANTTKANMVLSDVIKRVSSASFGEDTELAQRYLACHMLTLAKNSSTGGTPSGAITKEKVGDIEVTYASGSSPMSSSFDSTQYGQMFEQLRKENLVSFIVGEE